MPSDPTPDLDALERVIAEARSYPMVGLFRLAGVEEPEISMSADFAEWYLRAARERDDLRAKVERLTSRGIEDLRHENDELRADMARAHAATEHAIAGLRARAEKAEARVKELEAALHGIATYPGRATPITVTKKNPRSVQYEFGVADGHRVAAALALAALAQKEPKP